MDRSRHFSVRGDCCASAGVLSGRRGSDAALTRSFPIGGSDVENLDFPDYKRQAEYLDSQQFGTFPVDGRANRVAVYGKGQVSVHRAWRMRMAQWDQPAIYGSHVHVQMPFLRDRDERNYIVALDLLIREHIDGHKRPHAILSHFLLDAPYAGSSFLTWSRIWRNAVKFEVKYRIGFGEAHFLDSITVKLT